MGAAKLYARVPFGSVNVRGEPGYQEGLFRHHLTPSQCLRDPDLGPFLLSLRAGGVHMDDFVTNGILLPAIPSVSKVIGLPLHIGGHPNYNSRIIAELHMIRVSCESVWGDSQRQKKAVQGVRGVQDRARHSINSQGADHIDWVVLPAPADASLDCLIDRLFARLTPKMAIFGA